jgi:hypothetical protein
MRRAAPNSGAARSGACMAKSRYNQHMVYRKALPLLAFFLALVLPALADVTGKWAAEFDTQIGAQKYTYDFKVEAGNLTGTAAGPQGSVAITEGKVSGDDVYFVENMEFGGMEIRIEYSGKLVGDELRMTRKVGDFATEELVAKRVK